MRVRGRRDRGTTERSWSKIFEIIILRDKLPKNRCVCAALNCPGCFQLHRRSMNPARDNDTEPQQQLHPYPPLCLPTHQLLLLHSAVGQRTADGLKCSCCCSGSGWSWDCDSDYDCDSFHFVVPSFALRLAFSIRKLC